ncbi:uncharacterized protein [Anabrus simplex]|uniref:uncharacterized protein n=1 Tax=Anabrus simplex TaxID=316456 RepID=UPI0035A2C52A
MFPQLNNKAFICVVLAVLILPLIGCRPNDVLNIPPHPGHPDMCMDPWTDKPHAMNSTWMGRDTCSQLICRRDPWSYQLKIEIVTCSEFRTRDNCTFQEGKLKDGFPKCCGFFRCSSEPSNSSVGKRMLPSEKIYYSF